MRTRQSATLAVDAALRARRAAGEDVLHLAFGEAGLPVPEAVAERLRAAARLNGYGPVAGSAEAREAAAGWFGRRGLPTDAGRVVFAPGSKPLLYALIAALPGDVVLPRPSWVSYAAQSALAGKRVHRVPVPDAAGGIPDPEALAALLARERPGVLVLTVPDNPTGTVAGREVLAEVCALAERHGLAVVADEIYADLLHPDGPSRAGEAPGARGTEGTPSAAALLPERTVVTTGLSKATALGGWRVGFARVPEGPWGDAVLEELTGVASEIWSALAAPMQAAAAWVLGDPPEVRDHVGASRRLHAAVARAVHAEFTAAGALCRPPAAGFYLYPDFGPLRAELAERTGVSTGAELAAALLERHGVGVLAGAEFGDDPAALRFRAATSLLYGETEAERRLALGSADPLALPWISGALTRLRAALAEVTGRA
ncbi:pyridoxal phosphate-dependent aminotransferase [Streptomyces sp. DSM 44917]|uniref:Aminotransferase n=1 Tax=Streptomyces boetiae TaxID=3075541 RepID=A0ABU2LCR7_9ACTN|nr:pyridoxal phosphate-dependent aminotransferase [Streptomyces sp. DSM 44917]MDT0309312.1 pyridoxal phosphate-dependent aminotransferase [Streptomyces sp. DSM 44917]